MYTKLHAERSRSMNGDAIKSLTPLNIEKILKLDVLKTDYYGDLSYPSYLYYNPYDTTYSVEIDVVS